MLAKLMAEQQDEAVKGVCVPVPVNCTLKACPVCEPHAS
jgi:hypothetical protein